MKNKSFIPDEKISTLFSNIDIELEELTNYNVSLSKNSQEKTKLDHQEQENTPAWDTSELNQLIEESKALLGMDEHDTSGHTENDNYAEFEKSISAASYPKRISTPNLQYSFQGFGDVDQRPSRSHLEAIQEVQNEDSYIVYEPRTRIPPSSWRLTEYGSITAETTGLEPEIVTTPTNQQGKEDTEEEKGPHTRSKGRCPTFPNVQSSILENKIRRMNKN